MAGIKVPTAAAAADKLVQRAQAASTEYGIKSQQAAEDWAANSQAAVGNFGAAISAGGMKERWARGVAKAGSQKYARKIKDVGADRFSPGVAAGKQDYATNVDPYLQTIASVTLPPRQPRGSEANINRVREVDKALNARRLAALGSS